jgi:hypothetical protein
MWKRHVEHTPHDVEDSEDLELWFTAVKDTRQAFRYLPEDMYSMDDLGFQIGGRRSSEELVSLPDRGNQQSLKEEEE